MCVSLNSCSTYIPSAIKLPHGMDHHALCLSYRSQSASSSLPGQPGLLLGISHLAHISNTYNLHASCFFNKLA